MNFLKYKLWIESALLALLIFMGSLAYLFVQNESVNVILMNRSLAFTAIIMIDLSFIVSGTSYFWGIGKTKMSYRKMVGVIGFVISLVHASIASNIFFGSYVWITYTFKYVYSLLPALLAILIMTMMVVISNWGIPNLLGGVLWRRLLRVGYVAIFFIIIHATILSYSEWIYWFTKFSPIFPPLSLIAFLFSVFTIILRIALFIVLKRKSVQPSQIEVPLNSSK
ncbi:hypothetical protein COV24_03045 [candidate division WWE3 bacterium CG10_big_fil_rev_8_21_14_0_10_32_10]|uniref:Ferric oxidoreductase domain-containing protein n=1 Tax=candidate division WWE3 bacterium CG10_big_fil_rev_8_21_14_0_10_32_10 TaxID=1975090 RepID=A0A2H0RAM0_UNCKA|nr:MAG: hypothetical protein COV24_03045 [candidate division WWE3 bacterium CG10_big_fil_rev_8_21_14_0_10_32_10]